jgi:Mg-chelatase subunit ChlD
VKPPPAEPATDAATRWRLVLGRHADAPLALSDEGDPQERRRLQGRDDALGFLYDREHESRAHRAGPGAKGVASTLGWLAGVRSLFPREAVEVLERDAIVRYGLTDLLTDPATLRSLTPSVELVGAILALKERMPPPVRVEARRIVREVVSGLASKLRREASPSLFGAPTSAANRPLRTARNVDWSKTVRRNLDRWDPEASRLIPRRVEFRHRQRNRPAWRVIVAVDQSGSMAETLVHAAVVAAVFATMPAVTAHLVLWDDRVVDMSGVVHDPLEVLLSAQLGGGTQLYPALRYCADLVTEPERTVLAVVSDFVLYDAAEPSLALAAELAAEGVRGLGLCALDPAARGTYDERFARRLAGAGWWVAAVTPKQLVERVGRLLA